MSAAPGSDPMPESGGYALPLHVEEYGDGHRPVMLLHGFGATSYTWRAWIGSLAKEHKVWSVELKGHGSAPAPPDDLYSIHDHADLIRRLIVQKDLRELTLVGHSMGGGIALLVALLLGQESGQESRLERLVLVAGAAYAQRLPPFIALASRGRLSEWGFRICPKRLLIRRVLRSIVFDPASVTDSQVTAYSESLHSPAHRAALIKTAVQIVPPDLAELTKRFPEIDVPTLLLRGEHDWVVPLSVAERLLSALPKARLEIMENCGHIPPEEFPKESLEIVLKFLGEGKKETQKNQKKKKKKKEKKERAKTTAATEKTPREDPSPEIPDMSGPEEADT